MSVEGTQGNARILVVDDDQDLLRAYERVLVHAGYSVDLASDGQTAIELLKTTRFEVVLTDVVMPGMDGIQLLRKIREYDLDLPVVLVAATPTLTTAIRAIEYGALRYMEKPVEGPALAAVVQDAVRLHRMGRLKREIAASIAPPEMGIADRPSLELSFERALESLWMAYQPIVGTDGALYGYEALLRSREPSLPHPGALLGAAERLDRLWDLGRAIRARVAEEVSPSNVVAFVNLHTKDLADEALYEASGLSGIANRVILEITERAALGDVKDVPTRIAALRSKGFRLALDDLGAGYAGLTSFAQLTPEVVKLDMSLIRSIDADPLRQKLVRSMTTLCHEMEVLVVAEGIETRAELDMCVALRCDLLQGYFIAKPGPAFPAPVRF
jgi:EAL domain-containing protein (putative c-di-GMP-specific phosphodiesterase class I)/CheY-like chemotaxis protein